MSVLLLHECVLLLQQCDMATLLYEAAKSLFLLSDREERTSGRGAPGDDCVR